ncbi:MAG: exodeoxyribonuclease V beta subunit [Candidatus Azotimanducaceae bacterium]|jgi:exodeoxyribonuclease V beta subunit
MAAPLYERFELVTAPLDEGTVLLEASAGTGKTYTLTGILVRMLLEGQVEHVEQALVVTFTSAAADELKNRLRAAIQRAYLVCLGHKDDDPFFQSLHSFGKKGATQLRRALDEFDQASVMTIHGFCKRLLDESAFESDEPFDLDFAIDETPLWHAAAADALRLVRKHDSLMLGSVLHEAKLDPEALVRLYRNWQRYPNVLLEPSDPQLGVHLANLRAAVHRAAAQWDDELLDHVAGFKWLQKSRPTTGDLKQYFAQATEPLDGRPELCLSLFDALSTERLQAELFKRPAPKLEQPFFATCDEVRAERLLTVDHLRTELMIRMHERLDRIKREQALLTFDDLLSRTHAAITDPARRDALLQSLHARYSVALIDEFQDTDERQYEILSQSFRNRPLFLVGDPKQSIYGFRGADLRTYLSAVSDAVQKNTLQINFRSSEHLVTAVNQLFARAGSFVEPDIRMQKVRANAKSGELQIEDDDGAAMRFRLLEHEINDKGGAVDLNPEETRRRISRDVTNEIQRLLDGPPRIEGRRILPRHIAVLSRRNSEAVMIQEHLRDAGIVSVIGKAGDVFETDELAELERLLLAVQRPNDVMSARAAMTTRLWGYNAEALANLEQDEAKLEQELNRLETWRLLWIHKGFVVMKEQLLQDLKVEARMLLRNDGERRLTNLQQLCEMLHQAEHDHRLSPEGLLHWLRHECSNKDEIDYQRRELRLESDEDAVQILTMHGSKGLQYEIVFCPFLWDGRGAQTKNTALDDERDGKQPGDRRFAFEVETSDPGWLNSEADRLAEDCRLAYVALTRAKRRCYVHWGPIGYGTGGYWRSALAWLLQPDHVDQNKKAWQITWGKAYKSRSGSLATDLQRIADNSHGSISIDHVDEVKTRMVAPGEAATDDASNPTRKGASKTKAKSKRTTRRRESRRPLVVHSFSSLVAGSEPGMHAHEVRDPDTQSPEVGQDIFGFARGAEAGLCLHAVLEHVNLHELEQPAARELVVKTLTQHGLLEADAHPGVLDPTDAVLENLRNLAGARVHADGATVLDVCGGVRIAEWKFTIPMARPDLPALAECFAQSSCKIAQGYANRLSQLAPQHFAGFLTGFADLITECDDRYWIVDWKSNHLGNAPSDYGESTLLHAMQGHDYILQYHLYVLAWHRHLRARLPDYNYDQHFGGVSYAFLRGAVPTETSGMFYARPPRELIDAMDAWAAGEVR